MRYPELERQERWNAGRDFVKNILLVSKLGGGVALGVVSLKWLDEVMSGSAAAFFLKGLLRDGLAALFGVFDAVKP